VNKARHAKEKVVDQEEHIVYLEEELKKMLANETTLLAMQKQMNQEVQQEMKSSGRL
jgi:hypothetical protein